MRISRLKLISSFREGEGKPKFSPLWIARLALTANHDFRWNLKL